MSDFQQELDRIGKLAREIGRAQVIIDYLAGSLRKYAEQDQSGDFTAKQAKQYIAQAESWLSDNAR